MEASQRKVLEKKETKEQESKWGGRQRVRAGKYTQDPRGQKGLLRFALD